MYINTNMNTIVTSFIPRSIKTKNNSNSVVFCAARNTTDTFEYVNPQKPTMLISPYNNIPYYFPQKIDLDSRQIIDLKSKNKKNILKMDYDPQKTEIIFDKKNRKEIEVVVLKSENPKNKNEFGIHIFSKDLKTEYGQAMYYKSNPRFDDSFIDIEEVFIKSNDKNIKGINKIADKYAIQHCKETDENKWYNVFSYPNPRDYRANYNDGKRFIVPQKGSNQYKFLMKNYNNYNPNEIMENQRVDTSNWPSLKMCLPSEKVNEYESTYTTDKIYIYNSLYDQNCYIKDCIDLTRPRKMSCYSEKTGNLFNSQIIFNPNKVGQIYDKVNKTPIDVFILEIRDNRRKDEVAFHFMSKDLQKEYGYVKLDKDYKGYMPELIRDYPNENIIGERIVVSYLENFDDEKYGGIGKLADKIEVKYCVENDITPNIISVAGDDSHIAHYSRGKRFIKPDKESNAYDFLLRKYGSPNPNRVLHELWDSAKKSGNIIDLKDWNKYDFAMYLPHRLVDKYKNEK